MNGITGIDIVFIILGAVSLLLWLLLYFAGKKYNNLFDDLDDREYPLSGIYSVGYAFLKLIGCRFKSKADRKMRQNLEVLYGAKYTDYYLRVVRSQQIAFALTIIVFMLSLYGFKPEPVVSLYGIVLGVLVAIYVGRNPEKKVQERSNALLHDFSEVVSKLALLTNAGMILREAWQETAFAGKGVIYSEMQKAFNDMNNGVAEIDAVYSFGLRCMIPEAKKFASTIVQGMTKGNRELASMLQEQSKETWDMKKQLVRREGEKAASKLLIPICIMFVGILIMIVVPIFANL